MDMVSHPRKDAWGGAREGHDSENLLTEVHAGPSELGCEDSKYRLDAHLCIQLVAIRLT